MNPVRLRIVVLLVIFFAVSLSLVGQQLAPTDGWYQLRIDVSATNYWAELSVDGAQLLVTDWEVISGADTLDLMGITDLHFDRPCCPDSRVRASFDVYISGIEGDEIAWTVIGGGGGSTFFSVYLIDSAREELLETYSIRGSAGMSDRPYEFAMPADRITSSAHPGPLPTAAAPAVVTDPLVLAFYYPWYGSPDGPRGRWDHWNPVPSASGEMIHQSTHEPLAGYYDSQEPETIRRHIEEAKSAGIDGFICSWWGSHTPTDDALDLILSIAEEMEFVIAVYVEKSYDVDEAIAELTYVARRHAGSPAFLHQEERPVLFLYGRTTDALSSAQWAEVRVGLDDAGVDPYLIGDGVGGKTLDVFDGLHDYATFILPLEDVENRYESAGLLCALKGKLFAATVAPGLDKAGIGQPEVFIDRRDGGLYRDLWAIAIANVADWILITSYNEWHEGTEIEPSVEYGDAYLVLTCELADLWQNE